jgi:hypothetical protein
MLHSLPSLDIHVLLFSSLLLYYTSTYSLPHSAPRAADGAYPSPFLLLPLIYTTDQNAHRL